MEIPSIEQARGPDERPLDVGCVEGILARELRRLIPLRGGSHWVGASTLGRYYSPGLRCSAWMIMM